ncbi:FAD-dependent 5-carboxymethylaminomethyl-2-thiouridine(34) oxidoreductase MnmC [Acinetobacter larvae]|uniref:tRNA 5-methylaminomethyl-2-thiouridine biosynthesis bifunctional protein MnmC n=1 Tax=Acinetobacter larvae TaxID=1789224 RepID=A0A1B2M2M8_9GAMM|nr:FAD-dependent 5-carboxymethylaminomethyl-2-thiouridine(34) oxidoreductase MnmC [Acinetobacter larvae]AOA59273.1 FAD-dependent cmnm(5)s(2)U34 oxidoreductase [Acinetobacter larvae]
MSHPIQCAELTWQTVDGIDIPISKQFGDVYFSKDNGLLETRHVFLAGNDLTERLSQLQDGEYFNVGETGFGTGLNILALWQLWQQHRPNNRSHLHAVSVEKYPLTREDLIHALAAWPELAPLAAQLIAQYPLPIAGCHRLHFPAQRFSLDLWLGDAQDIFPNMVKTGQIHAWFLDGFAPSCNPDMWQQQVLDHIIRLSGVGTSFASFSVAGVLKRGLKQHGIQISRPRGFGHKREMLKGIWPADPSPSSITESHTENRNATTIPVTAPTSTPAQRRIAVIGAGIAGLSCAWALAQRGHQVEIFDQSAPLAGASGNPLALLNPKLCPIEQSAEHLMTLAWQYALKHYANFTAFRAIGVRQLPPTGQKSVHGQASEQLLALVQQYPQGLLHQHPAHTAPDYSEHPALELRQAGVVTPQQLAEQILAHPHIQWQRQQITALQSSAQAVSLWAGTQVLATVDQVVICASINSADLHPQIKALKPIRGQVSYFAQTKPILPLDIAYSYGGYAMALDQQQMIIGASFHPNRADDAVLLSDHQHNAQLLQQALPQLAAQLPALSTWQGRASVRAQSPDYFPLLGKVDENAEIYCLTGLGSKGFLFAPLCSEVLAAIMCQQCCPIPEKLFAKLSVQRFHKKPKPKKAYYPAAHTHIDETSQQTKQQ